MPPASNFTNVRPSREVPPTPTFKAAPYIAGRFQNGVAALTPKEREARRQARTHHNVRSAGVDYSMGASLGGNTTMSGTGGFFSVQLSSDFLELPQSIREKREIFKHFYQTDPIVKQAIDLHTELPLSKVRLAAPKPTTCPEGFDSPHEYGQYILRFFERMQKRMKLFERLIMAVHEYNLMGNCAIFAEDSEVQVPPEIGYEAKPTKKAVLDEDGNPSEEDDTVWVERKDREEQELAYYRKNYKGWDKLIVLPIDQIKFTSFNFTDKVKMELIPSDKDRALIEQAKMGDPIAEEMAAEIPDEVREHLEQGKLIPLGTDPDEGSFAYHLAGRRGAGDEMGQSTLDCLLRTLYFKEKLRQAQTQIASRAMTPKRVVWAEDISEGDVDALREQVDLSLVDPDYSIITNYELHWDEMGSRDRLLDLSSEYEQCDKHLLTGLGVTETLMSGESLYSGDRLKLEVINTRYLFLREVLQEYVEEYLFRPVARRKGFVEKDKWGEEIVLYPRLSFTRLPLRDSQDTFDALLNLYQKGSIPIELILELFNIDPDDAKAKLERDFWTVNDATFNELIRGIYGSIAQKVVDGTDLGDKLIEYLKLRKVEAPDQAESRF